MVLMRNTFGYESSFTITLLFFLCGGDCCCLFKYALHSDQKEVNEDNGQEACIRNLCKEEDGENMISHGY